MSPLFFSKYFKISSTAIKRFCSHELLMFNCYRSRLPKATQIGLGVHYDEGNGETEKELCVRGILKQHQSFDQIPLGHRALIHSYLASTDVAKQIVRDKKIWKLKFKKLCIYA